MNELNYASIEASQRLLDVGIVLETDLYWRVVPSVPCIPAGCIELITIHQMRFLAIGDDDRDGRDIAGVIYTPCPSMAEVWRELPSGAEIFKQGDESIGRFGNGRTLDTTPTDALIDLLIWIRKDGME